MWTESPHRAVCLMKLPAKINLSFAIRRKHLKFKKTISSKNSHLWFPFCLCRLVLMSSPQLISLLPLNTAVFLSPLPAPCVCVYLVGGERVSVSWHGSAVDGHRVPDAAIQIVAAWKGRKKKKHDTCVTVRWMLQQSKRPTPVLHFTWRVHCTLNIAE